MLWRILPYPNIAFREIINLDSGQIRHLSITGGEDLTWEIESDCDAVHVFSSLFSLGVYGDKGCFYFFFCSQKSDAPGNWSVTEEVPLFLFSF